MTKMVSKLFTLNKYHTESQEESKPSWLCIKCKLSMAIHSLLTYMYS